MNEFLFRVRDVLISSVLLVLLAPLLVIVAVVVRLDSPGPALFRQSRVGKGARRFQIHKFRTMRIDSSGLAVSTTTDRRITRVGRILRVSKIDELPQLVNVLRGEMSLVGPRPEVPQYVEHWPADLRATILSVRPGITDPTTIWLRDEAELLAEQSDPERYYIEELLPTKARQYADYVRKRTLSVDAGVMVATAAALFRVRRRPVR